MDFFSSQKKMASLFPTTCIVPGYLLLVRYRFQCTALYKFTERDFTSCFMTLEGVAFAFVKETELLDRYKVLLVSFWRTAALN